MTAVIGRLREKILIINKTKSNSKPLTTVSILGYDRLVKKIESTKLSANYKGLQSFCGPANFYGRMIQNFFKTMLPLKNYEVKTLSGQTNSTHAFRVSNKNTDQNQPFKSTPWKTNDCDRWRCFRASKWRGSLTGATSSYIRFKEAIISWAQLLQDRRRSLGNRVCVHTTKKRDLTGAQVDSK